MRRLIQLLMRLYPKAWRDRYGAELAALTEEIEPCWSDVWDVASAVFRARCIAMTTWRWIAAGAMAGVIGQAAFVYVNGPGLYESVGRIAAPGLGVAESIKLRSPTWWGEENVLSIARNNGLVEKMQVKDDTQNELFALGKAFFATLERDGTLSIHARAETPEQARAVARDVMNLIGGRAEPYWKLQLVTAPSVPVTQLGWDELAIDDARSRLLWMLAIGVLIGALAGMAAAKWRPQRGMLAS